METKFCKICNEFKPINEFYSSQKTLICKYHTKELGKERKKIYRSNLKNKQKEKLKYQERKIRLWENFLIHNTKARNCENNLKVEDITDLYEKQKGLCYWFGIPLVPSLTNKHPQQPSIDRLDRTKGYTKDNVVLCCYTANIGRNETDLDIWLEFINLMNNKNNTNKEPDKNLKKLQQSLEEVDDRDEYVIYDDNLIPTTTKNINEYFRTNNLDVNSIRSYRKKTKTKTQKGIIILNRTKGETVNKRIYHLISPENTEIKLTSLRSFCLENGLNDSALQRVAKGEINHYKGWKCKYETIILN